MRLRSGGEGDSEHGLAGLLVSEQPPEAPVSSDVTALPKWTKRPKPAAVAVVQRNRRRLSGRQRRNHRISISSAHRRFGQSRIKVPQNLLSVILRVATLWWSLACLY